MLLKLLQPRLFKIFYGTIKLQKPLYNVCRAAFHFSIMNFVNEIVFVIIGGFQKLLRSVPVGVVLPAI
jgi:hypothetical protein